MRESKAVTTDPICGMIVDEPTALHAERDGKTFYFAAITVGKRFFSRPHDAKPGDKSGGCCG